MEMTNCGKCARWLSTASRSSSVHVDSATHIAEVEIVPVRIKNMTDAEVIEAQLIETATQ
jgi:hypothetical protein